MEFEEKINKLEEFKAALASWSSDRYDAQRRTQMRTYINQNKPWVRQEIIEAGCFVTVTIGPPPAIGGLLMRTLDPFSMIFDAPYGRNLIPLIRKKAPRARRAKDVALSRLSVASRLKR